MSTLVFALTAYLIGSISFAVIVSRAFGLPDPRSYGSGNPGATNVLRTGSKAAAVLALLGDSIKGWFAVFVAQRFSEPEMLDISLAATALAVMIGHMYPLFFRFQGGKGVSTMLGILVALNYYLAAGAVATWLIIVIFFRISSLAALISALFVPFFSFLLYGLHPIMIAATANSLLIIWRHKSNIQNLLAGRESRIGGRDSGSSG